MNDQSKNAGFSLLEVMIVLAIIAIVAVVGMPGFLQYRNDAKIQGAMGNLRIDFGLAKQRAIKENAFVAIQFTTNGYTMFLDNGAGANGGNWVEDGDETRLLSREMPAGVFINLGETTFGSNRTRFNGRAYAENVGKVVIEDTRGITRTIEVNKLGRITTS